MTRPARTGTLTVSGNAMVSDESRVIPPVASGAAGESPLAEQRCPHCRVLLYKADLKEGSIIEVKCRSCSKFILIG